MFSTATANEVDYEDEDDFEEEEELSESQVRKWIKQLHYMYKLDD